MGQAICCKNIRSALKKDLIYWGLDKEDPPLADEFFIYNATENLFDKMETNVDG